MKEINKLVRDKIPELMAAQGKTVTMRQINKENEVVPSLLSKLDEEISELKGAYKVFTVGVQTEGYNVEDAEQVIEEMADVMEVLYGLCYHTKINKMQDQVAAKRKAKYNERGGFEKMLFVETTSE